MTQHIAPIPCKPWSLVDEWSHELAADRPVIVYCAYGYNVGCGVTTALRERGFDAKFIRGGLSAWYAAAGNAH